jgi:hypothetical protein
VKPEQKLKLRGKEANMTIDELIKKKLPKDRSGFGPKIKWI